MGTAIITRNYQIRLPKDLRELTDINIGDRMITEVDNKGRIIIKKLEKSPVDSAFGIWKTKKTGTEFVNEIRKDWRR